MYCRVLSRPSLSYVPLVNCRHCTLFQPFREIELISLGLIIIVLMSFRKSGRKYHTVIDIIGGTCVFKVPDVLRRQNPEAYTPDVVTIGPFHHHKENEDKLEEKFQLMKEVKKSYLNEVLASMGNITWENLAAKVTEGDCSFETQARRFYGEPLLERILSKDFMEMMIVDGCFLVQLFRKCKHSTLRSSDDPVFNMDCMFHFLCHDILLVENQLPWFVILSLYTITLDIYPDEASLSALILDAFSMLPSLKQSCSTYGKNLNNCPCDSHYLHILDLLRASIVIPLKKTIDEGSDKKQSKSSNQHGQGTGKEKDKSVHDRVFEPDHHQIRTATELAKADIKFKKGDSGSIMDIEFKKGWWFIRNGILEIPQLNVGMSSEALFRNLIAMEQCYHGYSNEITSYAIFMDNLISSKEDLELLWKAKVIGNWMSDEDGCKFFSNLYKGIPHKKFYYVDLCKLVNKRHRSKWYQWLASLKIEKFANPWKILAFLIGFIAVLLTAWSSAVNIRVNIHKK